MPQPTLPRVLPASEKGGTSERAATPTTAEDVSSGGSSTYSHDGAEAWQHWLQSWSEQQRRDLKDHEESTKALIHEIKEELSEKLGQLERLQRDKIAKRVRILTGRQSPELVDEERASITGSMTSDAWARSMSPPAVRNSNFTVHTLQSAINSLVSCKNSDGKSSSSPRKAEKKTYTTLNNAMCDAVGCSRTTCSKTRSVSIALQRSRFSASEEEIMPEIAVRRKLFHIVHSDPFNLVMGAVVVAYAGAVGVMADLDMRAVVGNYEGPTWRSPVDTTFSAIFAAEVLLRFIADGMYYFTSKDRNWNIFDLLIAVMGFIDVASILDVRMGFLRVLRTFRAMRVLRVIRIFSFFKELRLMIASLMHGFWSLTWAFTLLIAVIYIFAVILMQAASDHITMGKADPEQAEEIKRSFGTMTGTIYSLTQAISGGRNWGEFAEVFWKIGPLYGACFTAFVIFVVFGVLNILTGVFVEGTSSLASVDKELMIQDQMAHQESVVNQMRLLFKEMDVDNSGTLTYTELRRNLNDPRVQAYFGMLQMDVSEASGLFQLLDKDETGEVSIEEFIMTCMRLKGSARSIDLATMLMESKRLHTSIRGFMRKVDDTTDDIHRQLEVIKVYQELLTSDLQ